MEYSTAVEGRVDCILNKAQMQGLRGEECGAELLFVYSTLREGAARRRLVGAVRRKGIAAMTECARQSPFTAQSAGGTYTATQEKCLGVVLAIRSFCRGRGCEEGLISFTVRYIQNAPCPSVRAWLCLFLGCCSNNDNNNNGNNNNGNNNENNENNNREKDSGASVLTVSVCAKALVTRARDKSPVVRVAAARAAAAWEWRSNMLRRLLVVLMRTDPAAEVRRAALGGAGGEWAACAVCERTRDSSAEVRRAAFVRAAALNSRQLLLRAVPQEAFVGMMRLGMCDADEGVRAACADFAAGAMSAEDFPQSIVEELCEVESSSIVDAVAAHAEARGCGGDRVVSLATGTLFQIIAAGRCGKLSLGSAEEALRAIERMKHESEVFRREMLRAVRRGLRTKIWRQRSKIAGDNVAEEKDEERAAIEALLTVTGSTPGVVRERTKLALLLYPDDPVRAAAYGAGTENGNGEGKDAARFVAIQQLLTSGAGDACCGPDVLAQAHAAAMCAGKPAHLRIAAIALLATASNVLGRPAATAVCELAEVLCRVGEGTGERSTNNDEDGESVYRGALEAMFDVALVQGCGALSTQAGKAEENFGALLKALGDPLGRGVAVEGVAKLLLHGADVTPRMVAVGASMLLTALALHRESGRDAAVVGALFAALARPAVLCAAALSALRYLLFAGAGSSASAAWLVSFAWTHCGAANSPISAATAEEVLALPVAFPSARHCLLTLLLCEALGDAGSTAATAIPALVAPFLPAALKRGADPVLAHLAVRCYCGDYGWKGLLGKWVSTKSPAQQLCPAAVADALERYIERTREQNSRKRQCMGGEDVIGDDEDIDLIDPPSDEETRRRDREDAGIEDIDTPSDTEVSGDDDYDGYSYNDGGGKMEVEEQGRQQTRPCLLFAGKGPRDLICAAERALGGEVLELTGSYLPYADRVTHVVIAAADTPEEEVEGEWSGKELYGMFCGLLTGKWVMCEEWLEESVRCGRFLPEDGGEAWGVRVARERSLCGIRVCLTPAFLGELPTNAARREVKEILESFGGVTLLAPRYAAYSREAVVIRGEGDCCGGNNSSCGEGRKVFTWKQFLDKIVLLGKTWMKPSLQ